MIVGERIRQLRQSKKLSQGDIEECTGLLRCYLSRVENGHTVPSLETIEKIAAALKIPLYQIFYEGTKPPEIPEALTGAGSETIPRDGSLKEGKTESRLRTYLAKLKASDIQILLALASRMANRQSAKP